MNALTCLVLAVCLTQALAYGTPAPPPPSYGYAGAKSGYGYDPAPVPSPVAPKTVVCAPKPIVSTTPFVIECGAGTPGPASYYGEPTCIVTVCSDPAPGKPGYSAKGSYKKGHLVYSKGAYGSADKGDSYGTPAPPASGYGKGPSDPSVGCKNVTTAAKKTCGKGYQPSTKECVMVTPGPCPDGYTATKDGLCSTTILVPVPAPTPSKKGGLLSKLFGKKGGKDSDKYSGKDSYAPPTASYFKKWGKKAEPEPVPYCAAAPAPAVKNTTAVAVVAVVATGPAGGAVAVATAMPVATKDVPVAVPAVATKDEPVAVPAVATKDVKPVDTAAVVVIAAEKPAEKPVTLPAPLPAATPSYGYPTPVPASPVKPSYGYDAAPAKPTYGGKADKAGKKDKADKADKGGKGFKKGHGKAAYAKTAPAKVAYTKPAPSKGDYKPAATASYGR